MSGAPQRGRRSRAMLALLLVVASASACSTLNPNHGLTEKTAYANVTAMLDASLKAAGVTRFTFQAPDPDVVTCDNAAGNPDPGTVTLMREALISGLTEAQQRSLAKALAAYWASKGYSYQGASPDGTNISAATSGNSYLLGTDSRGESGVDGITVTANCFPSDHAYPQTNM